ncbi:PAS domain S-box protein [Rhodobacter sp. NTK016B]|uniref:methyl-accepting chemotaxis protein n=1 Tax=Rhodobacter sp. NTK016B TaxID=2759676 RepID=UPI001A8FF512|nr:PAS domain S-box protein [Rhodobacter sp. NTK016B]
MLGWSQKRTQSDGQTALAAAFHAVIDRTQATIQFKPDGTILTANQNFLDAVGYSLEEIVGRHHSIFVDDEHVRSEEYREFWKALASGEFFTNQYPRLHKDGSVVWLQATYSADINDQGEVDRVIKIATDITERQNSIEGLSKGIAELSRGNLNVRLPHSTLPDIEILVTAFNEASEQLSSAISSVKAFSTELDATAANLGRASSDLSQRTEAQAATLEQTAAAVHELTDTVSAAATSAREVEKSATNAKATAEHGGSVVGNAIDAMAKIEESSRQISRIIAVIEDIAFQTNLLALNAGVEAARAGDAGKGFAVVASEVRLLAQRSSESANDIKALISDSRLHVSTGVDLVNATGNELQRITDSVSNIYERVHEIALGTAEQASTLTEINSAVAHLDVVTQKNAAMVEQSTNMTKSLSQDARKLAQQMAAFKVDDTDLGNARNHLAEALGGREEPLLRSA